MIDTSFFRHSPKRHVGAFVAPESLLLALTWHGGDNAMHIVDYAAVGFLIACMIWAGAMALHKTR